MVSPDFFTSSTFRIKLDGRIALIGSSATSRKKPLDHPVLPLPVGFLYMYRFALSHSNHKVLLVPQ